MGLAIQPKTGPVSSFGAAPGPFWTPISTGALLRI